MPPPDWDGESLRFQSTQGTLSITALSNDVVRIRFTRDQKFGRDHSYAVVNRHLSPATVKAVIKPDVTVLKTASLKVRIQHSPLRISFANAAGDVMDMDDPEQGISMTGGQFRIAKRLQDDEHVYGFGEKCGRLDKRGWQLGGYQYVMWNLDTPAFDSSTDPLYVAVPFFMVTRRGKSHGIFLDNTWRSFFDVGREQRGLLTFGADGGDVDYYFINGPEPRKVIERYTALTGRAPLPPMWSLGYHQCRWSYYPESRVRALADTFRSKRIPADALWLDIHYLDGYKPFTWDKRHFPHPAKMISDLRTKGLRLITIIDAHPPALKKYMPYETGVAGNHFVKWPDGKVYQGPVWPSHAEKHPAPSVFPDFSRPATRQWWGDLYKSLLDAGVAGIWNDMNEPSVFEVPGGTIPDEVVFDNEGKPSTHRELHNVYGQLFSRSTFEGLSRLRPGERPFVLTRSSFAGGQRYAAVWTGDAVADWASLRQSIPMLLGLGLSGFPFVGGDIGGFVRMPSAELCTRWLQSAVFNPFMRMHTENATPDKEPWSYGWKHEAINRRAIELRYQLLPYIYNVMHEASETGMPAMRPLFLEFPDDERTAKIDDQFLFGPDLLVAPVLWEGADTRDLYLPAGDWFDYWTGRHYAGGKYISISVTLESIPMFVRGGGFIFRQPVIQHTGEMPGQPMRVLVAPAAKSEALLYEDDGVSLSHRKGKFMKRRFHQIRGRKSLTMAVGKPEGPYRPVKRDLILETWLDYEPKTVTEIGIVPKKSKKLPKLTVTELEKSPSGWSFEGGILIIKERDAYKQLSFIVKRNVA